MLQHFIKLIFKYKYDSWPWSWFDAHFRSHPGFQWLAISLHQSLLAIALGVQTAPFVIIQSNGQTWLRRPPSACEEDAHRFCRRWPWDSLPHGQGNSRTEIESSWHVRWESGFTQSLGFTRVEGLVQPPWGCLHCTLWTARPLNSKAWSLNSHLWRQQRWQSEDVWSPLTRNSMSQDDGPTKRQLWKEQALSISKVAFNTLWPSRRSLFLSVLLLIFAQPPSSTEQE